MNVIFLFDIYGFGGDWLLYLLSNKTYILNIIVDLQCKHEPMQNAIICCNRATQYHEYLKKYELLRIPFGVFHASDEHLIDDRRFICMQMCKFVLRTYFDPTLLHTNKVYTIALGWKDGVITKDKARKIYDWSFSGDPFKSDRQEALQILQNVWPEAKRSVHKFRGFNSEDGLQGNKYGELLKQSKFVLCATGYKNLESFRVYEALQAGSIPMTLSYNSWQKDKPSYWHFIFGCDPPFIHGRTWHDVFKQAKELSESPQMYKQKLQECKIFWKRYKKHTKRVVEDIILRFLDNRPIILNLPDTYLLPE